MSEPAGMFEPMPTARLNGHAASKPAASAEPAWCPIVPVPDDAPRLIPRHWLGEPSAVWDYRDAEGRLLFHVCRWDHGKDEKTIRPLSFCRDAAGNRAWCWQGLPVPRPLFALDRLALRPDAPVLLVEGEKTADAAAALFPEHVAVTSPNGSDAAGQADWSPLAGRDVVIWPDNDEPGRSFAADVAKMAREAGAVSVRVVVVPDAWPDGWDLADALPDGVTPETLAEMIEASTRPMEAHIPRVAGPEVRGPVRSATNAAIAVTLTCATEIEPEPIQWIWLGWLAAGKMHILGGAPGAGKTTIALNLVATATTGGRWPDGTSAPSGNVMIWSGEDDPKDTLVPRLIAAGADRKRVFFIAGAHQDGMPRAFDPATDMEALAIEVSRVGNVRILIVDPIVSAISGDSHKNAEVRRGLQPLADLATQTGCAVLGITHFTKGTSGRDPVERLTGSLAFGAVARVALVAARRQEQDDDGTGARMLCRAKSNIGPDDGGYTYDLEQVELQSHPGVTASQVVWGQPVSGTARELLAEAETAPDDGAGGKLTDAQEFLRESLNAGPLPVTTLKQAAKAAGLSWRTIETAKGSLGVETRKEGFSGGWKWQLPGHQDREGRKAASAGESCGLRDNREDRSEGTSRKPLRSSRPSGNLAAFGDESADCEEGII